MSDLPTYDLFSPVFRENAYQIFAALRERDPVLCQVNPAGGTRTWFVSRYDDVDAILRDDKRFVRDPRYVPADGPPPQMPATPPVLTLIGNHMLNKEGSDHRRLRGLVSKAFTPRMVEQLRDRVQAVADELLDQALARGRMDVLADYAFPLSFTVFAELLGIPTGDREKFLEWTEALMAPAMSEGSMEQLAELMQQFVSYLQQLFVLRRRQPQDDLITALLQVEEAGDRLNESELYSMVVLLITGGYESTASFLGNAVLALLSYPDQLARLRAEPALVPAAVEELLRYDAPFERIRPRWAVEDVEMRGQLIRRGDMVFVLLGAANHDPDRFTDPETLDIAREPDRHLAFGRGVHYCLGAPLARLESDIALATLIRRLPDLRLDLNGEPLTWRESFVRGLTALPVTWTS